MLTQHLIHSPEYRSALMSESLAKVLDLNTAWKRVRTDIANRAFIRDPYAVELVESGLKGWFATQRDATTSAIDPPALSENTASLSLSTARNENCAEDVNRAQMLQTKDLQSS